LVPFGFAANKSSASTTMTEAFSIKELLVP